MDLQPKTPGTRLIMNITRSTDGRYDGEISSDTKTLTFSGTLELLKVLEDLVSQPATFSSPAPDI